MNSDSLQILALSSAEDSTPPGHFVCFDCRDYEILFVQPLTAVTASTKTIKAELTGSMRPQTNVT